MKDLKKYLDFKYLCNGSKYKPEDLVAKKITIRCNYERAYGSDKKNKQKFMTKTIVVDLPSGLDEIFESLRHYLKNNGIEIFYARDKGICDFLTDINFDVEYIVREPIKKPTNNIDEVKEEVKEEVKKNLKKILIKKLIMKRFWI